MIIGIFNNKGGCGKTTAAVNLAYELAMLGKKTLLIDLDGQSNATMYIADDTQFEDTFESVVSGKRGIEEIIIDTEYKNLQIIPSTNTLNEMESNFSADEYGTAEEVIERITRAHNFLSNYDFVICDFAPTVSQINLALQSLLADKMIIPIECTDYGLKGLVGVLNIIESEKVLFVLPSKYDKSNSTDVKNLQDLRKELGRKVSEVIIRDSKSIKNAIKVRKPARIYFNCSASREFQSLAKEIIKRKERKK